MAVPLIFHRVGLTSTAEDGSRSQLARGDLFAEKVNSVIGALADGLGDFAQG